MVASATRPHEEFRKKFNVVGVHLPMIGAVSPENFAPVRAGLLNQLPTSVQSLVLVWSKPWAVGCMAITTAFAAGYRPEFCVPGCGRTAPNPLFDSDGWLPADTEDKALARALINCGIAADSGNPPPGPCTWFVRVI
jgi:hypothetical protein